MPQRILDKTVFSLSEVGRSIQKTLRERYKGSYWIRAELNKLNYYDQSGHCFPELVEKDGATVRAQMRAVLWREDFASINKKFIEVLKEPLKDGIKIMLLGRIVFDPVYGLSLRILDIDPSFTLGDLEKEKQVCIDTLVKEGLFEKNKERNVPLLPQRIAVISAETSKGYADFIRIIDQSESDYRFFHLLFPALLQGDQAAGSILHQLSRIKKVIQHFDLVTIIRGGGDDIGLASYNNIHLSRAVADFPLPVFTGIGHVTNETVTEMVAHTNAITPTKLAETLIAFFREFENRVRDKAEKIRQTSRQKLTLDHHLLVSNVNQLKSGVNEQLAQQRSGLREAALRLKQESGYLVRYHKDHLIPHQTRSLQMGVNALLKMQHLQLTDKFSELSAGSKSLLRENGRDLNGMASSVEQLHPDNVLKRGFSITRHRGKALKGGQKIKEGDFLETTLFDSVIQSKTITTKTKKSHDG